MNKLAEMIAEGKITIEELASATVLVERAELVKKGVEACGKTILFPFGTNKVNCYEYTDSAGEYESWGYCTSDGMFTCYCNWGGNHETGKCNLLDFSDVFMAFENREFAYDLKRFLNQQIEKAKKIH